jgi:hypothetical protein
LFFHAVTLSLNENGFGVMQQPVQDSGCQRTVVVEDFRPVLKRPVGRDDQGTLFVSRLMTWNKRSAPALSMGKKPSSSRINSDGRVYFFNCLFHRPCGLSGGKVLITSMAVANKTL